MTTNSTFLNHTLIFFLFILNITVLKSQDSPFETDHQLSPTLEPVKRFNFISKTNDLSQIQKIADIRYVSDVGVSTDFFDNYLSVKETAKHLGGNGYLIDTSYIQEDSLHIALEIFHIPDSVYHEYIDTLLLSGAVVIFGSIQQFDEQSKLKINGEKYKLKPLEYIRFSPYPNEFNQISIGGFMGSKISFYWEENNTSQYYYTSNFNVRGSTDFSKGIGFEFNHGSFNPIKRETAVYLSHFMIEK